MTSDVKNHRVVRVLKNVDWEDLSMFHDEGHITLARCADYKLNFYGVIHGHTLCKKSVQFSVL